MKRSDEFARTHLFRRVTWEDLDLDFLRAQIRQARNEDLAAAGFRSPLIPARARDVTTAALPLRENATAKLIARHSLQICGLPLIPIILEIYGGGVEIEFTAIDGSKAETGDPLATLKGPSATILQAERILLNFLQHLSGIATETARYAAALGKSPTRLLDTRKTTPGWRALEKYAVAQGGGWNHRLGLFDRVMLKDNHLISDRSTASKRLEEAVRRAREAEPKLIIEVEIDHLEQLQPVIDAGADVIMFDNFSIENLRKGIEQTAGNAYTEASGNITIENLPKLAPIGLDFISCGAITHQSRWQDIALDWENA